ncbi:MAG TPA: DinB family protein [Candidatus Angelobacter sp.]|nr:DinB family protein [Candidatus Angelobacter sp.]
MIGIPERTEAAEYYFNYIGRIKSDAVLRVLEDQIAETTKFLRGISEEKSLYRYAPDKWSIRQVWGHVNDAERVFLSRALWFARKMEAPLPSFEQDIAVIAADSDRLPWVRHIDEFRQVRQATLAFFRNLSAEAWMRRGTASGNPFTVRAIAYIIAGHVEHHVAGLKEKYL